AYNSSNSLLATINYGSTDDLSSYASDGSALSLTTSKSTDASGTTTTSQSQLFHDSVRDIPFSVNSVQHADGSGTMTQSSAGHPDLGPWAWDSGYNVTQQPADNAISQWQSDTHIDELQYKPLFQRTWVSVTDSFVKQYLDGTYEDAAQRQADNAAAG